ncbi:MAG: AbrB/MazE/SpoVT family DNA-binding domain-containing protein [Acidobacteriia bacterium]|nr:AbrB/MazE/SpoVT family DNA-binding domain-containing protein [Terriglobia bacterium]
METTRLSKRGQIVLPLSIRTARGLTPGTEFRVEDTAEGVLLRPVRSLPETRLEDVAGTLKYKGPPKSFQEMAEAVTRGVRQRHGRGRY